MVYLLALHGADAGGEGERAGGSVQVVFGQCEGLVHGQAGHVAVEGAGVQTHGRHGGSLRGAAAALTRVLAVVPIGWLTSVKIDKDTQTHTQRKGLLERVSHQGECRHAFSY